MATTLAILAAAALAAALVAREWSARRAIAALKQELEAARQESTYREQLANLGQMMSGLAQELKAPLQRVIGNTELMLATATAGAESREELHDIQENAERAAGIVRNLLAFRGTTEINRQWQDLNAIVARAADSRRAALDAADVRLDVRRAERLPLVYVDGPQLDTMIGTLLDRAAAASRAGSVVTIAARRRTGAEDRLVVDVNNESAPPGVEPAWQADLDACRRIVEAHGGSLEVEQPANGGIHVRVELPVAPGP